MGIRETLGIKMLHKEYDHIILLATTGSPDPGLEQPYRISLSSRYSNLWRENNGDCLGVYELNLTSTRHADFIALLEIKDVRSVGCVPLFHG